MSSMKTEYSLERINKSSPQLMDALDIYRRNTNSTVRTPTNEIVYWADRYNDDFRKYGDELMIFAFYKNRNIIGYAQMVFFSKQRLLVVDHVAIDEDFRRGLGTFFELIDQLKNYIFKKTLDIHNVVTEIAYYSDDDEPHQESRTLIRLLKIAGFSVAKARYSQPLLGMNNYETQVRAILMFMKQSPSKTIKHETYMNIVHTIYYNHYMRWYAPLPGTDDQKYRAHLDYLYQEINSSMSGKPIVLNGTTGFMEEGIKPSSQDTEKRGIKKPLIVILLLLIIITATFMIAFYLKLSGQDVAMLAGTSIGLFLIILIPFTEKPMILIEKLLKIIKN